MTENSITVSDALKFHKETLEAWNFSNKINSEMCNKMNTMKDHQRMIVVQTVSSYLRFIENTIMTARNIPRSDNKVNEPR